MREAAQPAEQESHAALHVHRQRCLKSFGDRRQSKSTIRESLRCLLGKKGCAAHLGCAAWLVQESLHCLLSKRGCAECLGSAAGYLLSTEEELIRAVTALLIYP